MTTPADPGFAALEALSTAAEAEADAWLDRMAALAALIAATPSRRHRGLAGEVGAALSIGEPTAQHDLDTAWELKAQPRLREAVQARRLTPRQVVVILDELVEVSDDATEAVLAELLAGRDGIWLRPAQLRGWLRRRIVRLDPEGVRSRRRRAEREESGVRYRALGDGLAQKVTTGPAALIQAAMRQLDRMTPPPAARAGGDDRTQGQLMLATELGAIAQTARQVGLQPVPLELELDVPVLTGVYRVTRSNALPEPVVVRLDLSALADALAATPLAGLLSDPDGEGAAQAGTPQRGTPQAPSRRHDGSVTSRLGPRPSACIPELVGHGPVDAGLVADQIARQAAGDGEIRVRRVLHDRITGVCAVDDKALTWTSQSLSELLSGPLPEPPPPTDAYRPTESQKRVVRARHPRCTFPGCRRPARCTSIRPDLDHSDPWDPQDPDGGRTTVSNLHPLCRHHHQVKQGGWSVTRHPDGGETWTSPLNRAYYSHPDERLE